MSTSNRRYQLQPADVEHAKHWIDRQVITTGDCTDVALTEYQALGKRPRPLQRWCDRYLSPTQWRRLQAAIRSKRRRRTAGVHVRLSPDAYQVLRARAKRDGVTLSEALLRLALAPPPPSPQVRRAKLVKSNDEMYTIECLGQSIGHVLRLASGRWLASLHEGDVRAERARADSAAEAVLRLGWVIVGLSREGETSGADPADPFEHAF